MSRTLLGLIAGSCLLGCSASRQPPGPPNAGAPALHALSDAKLRELMGRMNALMYDRFMTQPELDSERRKYAGRMAAAAGELDSTIDAILLRLPSLPLAESERTTFLALANQLRGETRTLQAQAGEGYTDAIPGTLERIGHTCTACHELFRDPKPGRP